jgi:hypothetical protein
VRQLGYSKLASLVGSSERVDSVIVVVSARSAEVYERERANLVWVGRETQKPIVMWSYTLPWRGAGADPERGGVSADRKHAQLRACGGRDGGSTVRCASAG